MGKRKQFLKSGKELFFKNGYINVSVKEICDKMNTTTGSFYFLFPSKEKLLEELLLEDLGVLWSAGSSVFTTEKKLKEKLDDYFEHSLNFVTEEVELMNFYKELLDESGIGGRTAKQIKTIGLKKQEEDFYYLLNNHIDDISHNKEKLKDLARYAVLILDDKQIEIVNKVINNQKVDYKIEKDFLAKAIEGLIKS